MPDLTPISDGVVTIRPPTSGDIEVLIAGRDEEFDRWLGPAPDSPSPLACIVVDQLVVGWIDYDTDRRWLDPGEVNVGYGVLAPHRGSGYATRALELLLQHLAAATEYRTATLLIDPRNEASLAVADRARFTPSGEIDASKYYKRPVLV